MQTNKWKYSAKSLCIWLYKLIGYSPPIFGEKMLRSSSIEFRVRREWNVPKKICTSLRRHVVPFVNGRYHFYDTWKSFDLLLRVQCFMDPSYPNLSPLSQHYRTDPQPTTWTPTSFFLTLRKRIFCLLYLNPGNMLHLSWLKAWLLMVASTIKNGQDRLRKGNRRRRPTPSMVILDNHTDK